jgi:hypothetical protein
MKLLLFKIGDKMSLLQSHWKYTVTGAVIGGIASFFILISTGMENQEAFGHASFGTIFSAVSVNLVVVFIDLMNKNNQENP